MYSAQMRTSQHERREFTAHGYASEQNSGHGDLDRFRGTVYSAAAWERYQRVRTCPVVEVRAGLGWGKSALITEAARLCDGHGVRVVRVEDGHDPDRISAACTDERTLFVVERAEIPQESVEWLIDRVSTVATSSVLISARNRHSVAVDAQRRGVRVGVVGTAHLRMRHTDLLRIADERAVPLTPGVATSVVSSCWGWPMLVEEFLEQWGARHRDGEEFTRALQEKLLVDSSVVVLNRLLGAGVTGDLTVAALPDRFSWQPMPGHVGGAIDKSLHRLDALGLGSWVS